MLWTKVAVLRDDVLVGSSVSLTGCDCNETAENLLTSALGMFGGARSELDGIVATGAGRSEVRFADHFATEAVCLAKGTTLLYPNARGIIDMGGESTLVVSLDEKGGILDYARNDKCAAGTGIFLDAMGKLMGVRLEDMGPCSLKSTREVSITSMCVVFAESEVVSLIHRQTPKEDILQGIHKSIASRMLSLFDRVGRHAGSVDNVAVGGLAQNTGVLACLETMMLTKLVVPEQPQLASALGAAIVAANGRAEA